MKPSSADIRDRLVETFGRSLEPTTKETIRQYAGADLLILRLWLEMAKDGKSASTLVELGQKIWEQRSQKLKGDREPFLRAMFIAAILGQFECDVAGSFLLAQANVSEQHLSELVRTKLLSQRAGRYSLPHRSFASLMVTYFNSRHDLSMWLKTEANATDNRNIILRYLQSIDPSQVWGSLELIQNAGGGESVD